MGLPSGLRALRHTRFRRYFIGQAVSILGTWIQTVAMSWLVYRLTGSAALLGLTAFLAQAPQLVVSPLAGVLIDRFDGRRMLMAVQGLMMVQALVLAVLARTDLVAPWHLVTLAAVFGVLNSVDTPLRQTLLAQLVDHRADLPNAVALNASLFNLARFIGPPVAGAVLSLTSEADCFALNAASFLALIVAMAGLRLPRRRGTQAALGAALREGIGFALRTAAVRRLLGGLALINLTASSYVVLMPVFARDVFAGDATTLGWLLGAAGMGAFAATGLIASRHGLAPLVGMILLGWGSCTVALAGLSIATQAAMALPLAFGIGFGVSLVNVSTNALLQSIVPDALRGRVISYFMASRWGMDALGGLVAGAGAVLVGAPVMVMGEAGVVAIGLVWMTRLAGPLRGDIAIPRPDMRI